jgi:hypothetical protein
VVVWDAFFGKWSFCLVVAQEAVPGSHYVNYVYLK